MSKTPRGKKRKLAAALSDLSSQSGSSSKIAPELAPEPQHIEERNCSSENLGTLINDVYLTEQQSVPKTIDSIIPNTVSGTTVLTAQANNLVPSSFLARRMQYITNIINCTLEATYSSDQIAELVQKAEETFGNDLVNLQTPIAEVLWKVTLATKVAHTAFLGPPTTTCLVCNRRLSIHNDPSTVVLFGLHGPIPANKITLRCDNCMLNYRYDQYGGETFNGYRYYDAPRPYVKASRSVYICRDLYCNLVAAAHHTWSSFEGAAESYNEGIRESLTASVFLNYAKKFFTDCQLRIALDGQESEVSTHELHRKSVAEAFWNTEIENELREEGKIDYIFSSADSREELMDSIDEQRATHPYVHTNCTDECKKRGCGKLYSFDGNWKLRYPVCMFRVPKEVTGFSRRLRYVDTCPNEPKFGHAFCETHCIEAEKSNIPSKLREYLRYCGILKDPDEDSSANAEEMSMLKAAEENMTTRSSMSNASDCQGTSSLFTSYPQLVRELDKENELDSKPACNKDIGVQKRMQKWSRGHLFIVRGGGHIDMWQPIYESEGPAQVFLIIISWMVAALGNLTRDERKEITLSYDNMCHIDCLHVARSPLPLPGSLSNLWLDVNKIIDSLHIKNHRDKKCLEKYHPKHVKDHNEAYNTMSCEQTFAWISRYKKIVGSMGKRHHHFYLHRMVKRRNKYIAFCYQHNRNPVQPKLH